MKRATLIRKRRNESSWSLDRIDRLPEDPKEREQMLRFWLEVFNARTINLEVQVDALWRMVSVKNCDVSSTSANASHFCGKVRSGTSGEQVMKRKPKGVE